jgi:hypothetical protein
MQYSKFLKGAYDSSSEEEVRVNDLLLICAILDLCHA